jgi:hypothetical protein
VRGRAATRRYDAAAVLDGDGPGVDFDPPSEDDDDAGDDDEVDEVDDDESPLDDEVDDDPPSDEDEDEEAAVELSLLDSASFFASFLPFEERLSFL